MLQKTRYLRLFLPFMLLCVLFFRLLTVPPTAEQQLAACFGRQLVVYGAVEPLSVRRQDGFSSAVLRCYKVYSDTELAYSGRLRVSVKGELAQAGCVVLKGTLEQLDSLRNPGGFDAASYNRVQELGGRLSKAKLLKTEPQVLWWQHFALLNKKLSERMEAAAGAEYGALLSGMVLGGSGRLDEETRELFTDNGLAHLLSVSGTHIVLLTGLLLALLQWVPLPWRKVIVITLLTAYALLCGLRPPVLRALAMSSVLLLGGSGAERGRLLCLVAALLLFLQPLWLADIGFQLSFGAAAGLLWLLPAAAGFACADRRSGSGFTGSTASCTAAGDLLFSTIFADCLGKQYRTGAGVGNRGAVGTRGCTVACLRRVSVAACCLADGAGADAGAFFCRPAVQHGGYRQVACLLFGALLCSAVCVGGFSMATILEQ